MDVCGRWAHQAGLRPGPGGPVAAAGLARQHPDVLPGQALRRRGQPPLGPAPVHRSRRRAGGGLAPERWGPPARAAGWGGRGVPGGDWPRPGHSPGAPATARPPRRRPPRLGSSPELQRWSRRDRVWPAGLAAGGLAPGGGAARAAGRPRSGGPAPAPAALPRGGAAPGAHPGGGTRRLEPVPAPLGPPAPGAVAGRDRQRQWRLEPARPQRRLAPRHRWRLAGARPNGGSGRARGESARLPPLGRLCLLDARVGGRGCGRGPALLEAAAARP